MALTAGTRLGPYEIEEMLGAGGMGEVYRARDTRLARTVAIKILPSADADLKLRFAREAKAIAGLAHPHICALYDVGHQDGTDFLVMEYLEGQTLAARLERGPIPFDDVLRHALEIASALDAAHRALIVHRDLKPGNVMLTRNGAKLVDFGLAKLRPAAMDVTAMAATVTGSTPLTVVGAIVGTPQYMAPEQLEGKDADARTDLFALGAILYEMVTGRPPFEGTSPASLIAAIMSANLPAAPLSEHTSPAFEHLVRTCLTKNPGERRQTAHDVLLDLEWIAKESETAPRSMRTPPARWAWIAAAAIGLAAAVAGVTWSFTAPETARQTTRVAVVLPEVNDDVDHAALSPEGRRLAFTSLDATGRHRLWIHALDSSGSAPIPGTEGAFQPFWSPDGRSVGFFADRKLKVVAADVGPALPSIRTLADAPEPRGGTWSPDGTIVFSRNIEDGLYRVAASGGGEVTRVTTLDRDRRENSHRWPEFLPNGRQVLYLARSAVTEHQGIYIGTPGSNDWKLVLRTPIGALVTAAGSKAPAGFFGAALGYLLFMRDATLMAQPFDLARLELNGEPTPVAEAVAVTTNRGLFSVSGHALAYRVQSDDARRAGWFDRAGKLLRLGVSAGSFPRISPDGRLVAIYRVDPVSRAGDIWVKDVTRGVVTRLTSHPAYDWIAIWSPDGTRIVFASNRQGSMDLYEKSVTSSEPERLLLKSGERKIPTDWSRDGRFLLFQQETEEGRWDLWALPMDGSRLPPFPVVQSPVTDNGGSFSPDGRWLAYTSDETGESQVYVQAFAGPPTLRSTRSESTGKWLISNAGGYHPRWRPDGRELFYLARDLKIHAVAINSVPRFEAGKPAPLFPVNASQPENYPYDVTPDGKGFVMMTSSGAASSPLRLVLDWTSAVK